MQNNFQLQRSIVIKNIKSSNLVTSELSHEVVEEGIVEVFTAEEGVAVGRLHLENSLLDLKDTDVESATAKIENSDTKN